MIKVSQELKEAIKKEFKDITGKLTIILNQGGVIDAYIEIKLK